MPRLIADISAASGQRAKAERRRSPTGRRRTDGLNDTDRLINAQVNFGPFRLDDRTKTVCVVGTEARLSPKLFQLLKIFIANPGKVFSSEELAADLWPGNERSDPGDIKQYVYLLRKAIEPDPARPRWLRNVRGYGYQLIIN
jgi:two-component system alkaline phosphatase synthesis response regulator PhoP